MRTVVILLALAFVVAMLPSARADVTIDADHKIALKMNEGSGLNVSDSSATGYDGTWKVGQKWNASGKYGAAAQFNTSNWINITEDTGTVLQPASALTTEAWVNWYGSTAGNKEIIGKFGFDGAYYGYKMRINVSGYVSFLAGFTGGTNFVLDSSAALTPGQWHYVVATFNGTGVTIWIDGVESRTSTFSVDTIRYNNPAVHSMVVGCLDSGGECYDGLLDNVIVSTVARPASYITTEYAAGTISPSINITSPQNTTYTNTTVLLSITNTSANVTTLRYSLNGAANVTFTNNTYITATEGLNNITVWANSSSGWLTDTEWFTVQFWNVSSQDYDSVLYSPSTTTYGITLAITNETAVSSLNATLVINGTQYSYDSYSVSGTEFTFIKEITVNESATEFTKLFYWNVTVVTPMGTVFSATSNVTQPGYKITITNCTYTGINSIKFSLYSELTLLAVTGDLEAIFTAWITTGDTIDYAFNLTGANSYTFCVSPNTSVYQSDVSIRYNATGYSDRTYYLNNETLDNTTNAYNLYLLPLGYGSMIKVHVVDKDSNDVDGAVVKIQKYLPILGWTTVQSFITDLDGEGLAFITLNTVQYRYVVEYAGAEIHSELKTLGYNGEVLQTLTISTGESEIEWTTLNAGFHPYCVYNNVTYIQRCYLNDGSGLVDSTVVYIDKVQPLGKTNICTLSSSLSSVTQSCTLGSPPSGVFRTTVKVTTTTGNVYTYVFDPIEVSTAPAYGDTGIFLQIILVLSFAMLGAWNPVFSLMMAVVALFVGLGLGINALTVSSVVGIAIPAFIIAYKVR